MGDSPDPHRHLLNDDGGGEGNRDEGQKEADTVGRPTGGVRQHAGTVVLAQKYQDARPHQQPEQSEAPSPVARFEHPAAVAGAGPVFGSEYSFGARFNR